MKAVAIERFGDRPELMELPEPRVGPGEVLISVVAASLNQLDLTVAQGSLEGMMEHRFPLILGFDAVGHVEQVGEGASRFSVGQAVFGQLWHTSIGNGTFAPLVAISETPASGALALVPDGISMNQAAAMPTAAMTAVGAFEATGATEGDRLLILGATGGVGSLLVQLAAAAGLHVIATARPDAASWMASLGATETLDYSTQTVAESLAARGETIDAVLDVVGDPQSLDKVAAHVRDGGVIVSIAFGVSDELAATSRVTASNFRMKDKPTLLQRAGREVAAGRLEIVIGEHVTLETTPAALERLRGGGARGKTVVNL